MTANYSGDPSKSDVDALRFALGDTENLKKPLFQDEELQYLVDNYGAQNALVFALEQLAVRFSQQADKSVGDLHISLSQKASAYAERAKRASTGGLVTAASSIVIPYAGGISRSDAASVYRDRDRVRPAFHTNMDAQRVYEQEE